MSIADNQYKRRDASKLGEHYMLHVDRMTVEALHAKSDIAAELAVRDIEIESLRVQVERLKAVGLGCVNKNWEHADYSRKLFLRALESSDDDGQ